MSAAQPTERAAARAADEALAARDRALKGLEVVLDEDRLAELLADGLPGASLHAVRPTYVRYKPGTSCLVGCTLETGAGPASGYVLLQRPNERGKLAKHADRARAGSGAGTGVVLLPRYAAAFYPFPYDRRVVAAPALADPRRRGTVLRRALRDRPEFWEAEFTVLRRKPERRLVARLVARSGAAAVVKAYAAEFPGANRAAKLVGGEPPATQRRLGRSRKWNVVVSEWLSGSVLECELAATPAAAAAAGAALARLHRRDAVGLAWTGVADEARRLAISARSIGCLLPRERRAAERVATGVAVALGADATPALTHGDFSADQVVIEHGRGALLDLDEAVGADPARDLGSFRAALAGDEAAGRLCAPTAQEAARALAAGYRAVGGEVPDSRTDVWTAAAILHLVPEPFRRRQAAWPEQATALLRRAEAILAS